MKKLFLFIILSQILLISCDDSVNPFESLKEGYVLNAILRGNSNSQIITLSKNYLVTDFEPDKISESPFIDNALIRVWYGDSIKIFHGKLDTTKLEKYNFLQYVYTNDNFKIEPATEYYIEAVLPDGKKFKSKTTSPSDISILHEGATFSDTLIPSPDRDYVKVFWEPLSPSNNYYVARYVIIYNENIDGIDVRKELVIPLKYENGEPVFSKASFSTAYGVKNSVFKEAFKKLDESVRLSSRITIFTCLVEIYAYDENLTSYIAAQDEIENSFSITLKQGNYSNIKIGNGIFGSMCVFKDKIKIDKTFVESFGFNYGLKGE